MVLETEELIQSESNTEEVERVDRAKELKAHEFRSEKKANSPFSRTVLQVIRDDEGLWEKVQPREGQQEQLEKNTAVEGETHRIGAAVHSNIYREPEAAALYDVALFDSTQAESDFFREQIKNGINYAPIAIDGIGGVYGTIFSAAFLKENPDNPPFGFDAAKRRGGIWAISGDVTLDNSWWRMNSRNRPENRKKLPLPGSEGHLNSLGAETQNLQVPDISSAQYPTNNELGRVLSHDSFISANGVFNAELVKLRPNRIPSQRGVFQKEYEDKITGERFFVYSDVEVQATGLGKEDLGFSNMFSSTREVLDQVDKDLKEGLVTPRVLTFFQLVEATTSNRIQVTQDFRKFGLIGVGDTSRVIREFFIGIGGVDPGLAAQEGFIDEVTVYGLDGKTREELAKTERPRYIQGLLEFARDKGGFFRVRPVEGRVVGVGLPKEGEGIVVYYKRIDQTPEGPVTTIGSEIIPRLVSAAGFEDESAKIYSGLSAELVQDQFQIQQRLGDIFIKPGGTIYYREQVTLQDGTQVDRVDIDDVSKDGKLADLVVIDKDGKTIRRRIDRTNLSEEGSLLLSPSQIAQLEFAGEPPEFKPIVDPEYDDEIPVAEKAKEYEIYRIGASTKYEVTEKEKRQTSAYKDVPQNTKSIFRYVRPVVYFAKKLAQRSQAVEGTLNLEKFQADPVQLRVEGEKSDSFVIPVDPKAAVQKLSGNLKIGNFVRYLAASRLNCVFPEEMEKLEFGIKRVESPDAISPIGLAIQFDQAIPTGGDWKIIDQFLKDPLTQRTLIQLTKKTSRAAEITIGIRGGKVDIRQVRVKSLKSSDLKDFKDKYQKLE